MNEAEARRAEASVARRREPVSDLLGDAGANGDRAAGVIDLVGTEDEVVEFGPRRERLSGDLVQAAPDTADKVVCVGVVLGRDEEADALDEAREVPFAAWRVGRDEDVDTLAYFAGA